MNESVFRELLGESLRREYAELDNAPEHKFSLKHRLAMKRIFAQYDKNVREFKTAQAAYTPLSGESMPYYSIKRRLIYALVIVLIMTMFTGWIIPLHRFTEEQIGWLRSRYDFPNMKTEICIMSKVDENSSCPWVGLFKESDEYTNFLADLVDMGLYTEDEIETIRMKPTPLDTRPKPKDYKLWLVPVEIKHCDESPLESYRDFVGRLENEIEYYTERAKDPSKALEGDKEFAELIEEKYLPLPKSFLKLLEKLYSDAPCEEENQSNILANSDKDDRRYLCEINEI